MTLRDIALSCKWQIGKIFVEQAGLYADKCEHYNSEDNICNSNCPLMSMKCTKEPMTTDECHGYNNGVCMNAFTCKGSDNYIGYDV